MFFFFLHKMEQLGAHHAGLEILCAARGGLGSWLGSVAGPVRLTSLTYHTLPTTNTTTPVSDRWTVLGRYRISSTRGGGFLNVFLADDCRASPTQRASDDMEKQVRAYTYGNGMGGLGKGGAEAPLRLITVIQPKTKTKSKTKQTRVFLSAPELAEACLQGRFKEAKWTQTVAMALLHLLLREREAGAAAWAGG